MSMAEGIEKGKAMVAAQQGKRILSQATVVVMTHTPGPWTVNGTAIEAENVTGEISSIASVNDSSYLTKGDWEANARLIAAVPELLTALTNIVEHYRLTPIDDVYHKEEPKDAIQKAITAIAHAEGRT